MKNKHFYQIFKLKIKPWIKYWLIKQTEFKGVLSDILEGISFYLTDSLNMKFKMFKIYGRTTQDGNPTPENPIPIKNTGDNGSVNEKVRNKNFIYDANHNKGTSITQDGITYTVNDDGSISVNGTATANGTYYMIGGNGSQPLTLKPGNYVLSGGISGDAWIRMFDGTNYYDTGSSTIKSFTLNDEINIWVGLRIKSGTTINATFYPQLEIGSTATSYVPHAEQNISFPLAQGQKLMEEDYLADDGVHHAMSEITINGTETGWKKYGTEEYYTNTVMADAKKNTSNARLYGFCDKIKTNNNTELPYWVIAKANANNGIDIKQIQTYWGFTGSTVEEFTAWLAENPIKLQYLLEEEVIEPYTEEQKTAWEEIKKARTYKNITHISSEDETPAELKIQYWKEV